MRLSFFSIGTARYSRSAMGNQSSSGARNGNAYGVERSSRAPAYGNRGPGLLLSDGASSGSMVASGSYGSVGAMNEMSFSSGAPSRTPVSSHGSHDGRGIPIPPRRKMADDTMLSASVGSAVRGFVASVGADSPPLGNGNAPTGAPSAHRSGGDGVRPSLSIVPLQLLHLHLVQSTDTFTSLVLRYNADKQRMKRANRLPDEQIGHLRFILVPVRPQLVKERRSSGHHRDPGAAENGSVDSARMASAASPPASASASASASSMDGVLLGPPKGKRKAAAVESADSVSTVLYSDDTVAVVSDKIVLLGFCLPDGRDLPVPLAEVERLVVVKPSSLSGLVCVGSSVAQPSQILAAASASQSGSIVTLWIRLCKVPLCFLASDLKQFVKSVESLVSADRLPVLIVN